ncbi:MAG: hypothetical protein G3M70_17030 [Candidatus Nitronauta litoralis]|uniref:ABC3 transporter permease protein domain-containing protein n=1 Tax=Candidatus Nitronauta litoralis TaxID=2705533 RepID=A0A7T0BZ36_9BACT|nr:MAG: hypothetical protein G3M70_17030 [Candidatus Nitronauta litoralis]
MIRWAILGLIRDRTRSLFPFLVVTVGVSLTVALYGFMDGIGMSILDMTSKLDTGHIRVVNKPYYEEEHLIPIDRSLAGQRETLDWLKKNGDSRITWSPRIRWMALMDVPDENGETKSQTPVSGYALDMLNPDSPELERLELEKSVVEGRLPTDSKELIVGYRLAENLDVGIGETVTLLGQSFDGGMAMDNYTVVGFVKFGIAAMDQKMALMDITGAQHTFYMEDMVTDWLGYLPASVSYQEYPLIQQGLQEKLPEWKMSPPASWASDDEPIVLSILDQRNLRPLVEKFELISGVNVMIFAFLMTLVLWNAGLINGVHRHGEMGLRLALGETHRDLVFRLAVEALVIGVAGSIAGCMVGGAFLYYLQEVGVDMGDAMAKSGMMLSDVARGRVSIEGLLWGGIPGIIASVFGTFIASLSVFKRSEASLFRELEVG